MRTWETSLRQLEPSSRPAPTQLVGHNRAGSASSDEAKKGEILGFLRMFHNDLKVYGIGEVGHLFSQRYEKYHIKKSHYQGALSRTKFFGKEV